MFLPYESSRRLTSLLLFLYSVAAYFAAAAVDSFSKVKLPCKKPLCSPPKSQKWNLLFPISLLSILLRSSNDSPQPLAHFIWHIGQRRRKRDKRMPSNIHGIIGNHPGQQNSCTAIFRQTEFSLHSLYLRLYRQHFYFLAITAYLPSLLFIIE